MTGPHLREGLLTPAALDRAVVPVVARLLAEHIGRVATARRRLDDAADTHALHDFRVALRRVRCLLRVYREPLDDVVPRRVRRGLRRLARATGSLRDLEVKRAWLATRRDQLRPRDRTGFRWLDARLKAAEAAARREARSDIDRSLPALLADLESRLTTAGIRSDGPSLASATSVVLAGLAEELGRHLDRIRTIEHQDEAHAARIAGKRVRYLLEPFTEVLPGAAAVIATLRSLQDVLGDMHDADVASEMLAEAMEAGAKERGHRVARAVRGGDPVDRATLRRERRRDPLPGLMALASLVHQRRADLWSVVEADWLARRAERLEAPLARLVAGLAGRGTPAHQEIERKYLLTGLPPRAAEEEAVEIEQGWLQGEVIHERIRRMRGPGGVRCTRTVKLGHGVSRAEYEEQAPEAVFETLWPLTAGRRVHKRRYRVDAGDLAWEVDEFLDRDLVLAEVELRSATDVPDLPEWLAPWVEREVTEESGFTNLSLAK